MGAEQGKPCGPGPSPVVMIMKQHPRYRQRIQRYMMKWHRRTTGKFRWPQEGTFDMACCEEADTQIRNKEAKDGNINKRRKDKRTKEKQVLTWFRQESYRQQMAVNERKKNESPKAEPKVTPTAPPLTPPTAHPLTEKPPPPPYKPRKARRATGMFVAGKPRRTVGAEGQDDQDDPEEESDPDEEDREVRMTGEMSGKFLMKVGFLDDEQYNQQLDSRPRRTKVTSSKRSKSGKHESPPSSETDSDTEDKAELDRYEKQDRRDLRRCDEEQKQRTRELRGLIKTERRSAAWLEERRQEVGTTYTHTDGESSEPDDPDPHRRWRHSTPATPSLPQSQKQRLHSGRSVPVKLQGTAPLQKKLVTMKSPPPIPAPPVLAEPVRAVPVLQTITGQVYIEDRPDALRRHEELRELDRELRDYITEANQTLEEWEVDYPQGRTRSGQTYSLPPPQRPLHDDRDGTDQHQHSMFPIIEKGQGQNQYVPWSFADMIGLASRLPEITDGAGKWITAVEESTAGLRLAIGDIKALLMHVAGKHITDEILDNAGLAMAARGHTVDSVGFDGHRPRVWEHLRRHYPEKMDPSKLEGEMLKDEECPTKFLHNFQRKWKDETGSAWNVNDTTKNLFKLMVKKTMPAEVQKCLDGVVGLMKMDWPLFSEHIVHHVDNHRRENRQNEEVNKQLANKLTQLQLGELTKQKKKTEKGARYKHQW